MARYIARNARTTGQLREQLLRQLESEAQKLLKQMMAEFTNSLASETQNILKSSLSGMTGADGNTGTDGLGAARLLSTAFSYALSRPKTTRNTLESSRSQQMESQFRLSSSQSAAEAAGTLSRGNKNV